MAPLVERPPVEVGVRDLRNHLSRYLDLVAGGVEVIVTSHGRPIARIGSPRGSRTIDDLITAGVVIPALDRERIEPAPLDLGVVVSDLVADQRR